MEEKVDRRTLLKAIAATTAATLIPHLDPPPQPKEQREQIQKKSDILIIDFDSNSLMQTQNVLSQELQRQGATSIEIALSQRFVRLYENHGKLVLDAQNKVFSQINMPVRIRPHQDMKPLSDLLDANVSKDESGNLQITGEINSERIQRLLQSQNEELVVAAFPFGETYAKFVRYEQQEGTNFTFKKEFHPNDDNKDIIAVDKLGRDLRIGYEGGLPQIQIFENGEIVERLTWSENSIEDSSLNLLWMTTEEFEEYKDNNTDHIVEVDNPGIEIIEGYDPRLAQDNFKELQQIALQNPNKLFVNAAGNRSSYSQEVLDENGGMSDNVLFVGGFTVIPDPLTAEQNKAYAAGNNIADIYIDPKDFDSLSISSSEATGIIGGVISAMIELGMAQNALNAMQLIKSNYLEEVTFYKKIEESAPISEKTEQGKKLNWQKLKHDLQQKLS